MPNLPWGFTNSTAAAGDVVVKRYVGPDAAARRTAERAFFTAFAGVLPVPRVLSAADCPELHTQRLPGVCGTDVIEEGHAEWVFPAAGALLRNVAQNAELLPGRGATVLLGRAGLPRRRVVVVLPAALRPARAALGPPLPFTLVLG